MKRKFSLLIAATLWGSFIWILSPYIADQAEPWDNWTYYWLALFFGGLFTSAIHPKYFWLSSLGILAGQLFVFTYQLIFIASGPLWPIGLLQMFTLSLISLAGAFLFSTIWKSKNKLFKRNAPEIS